MELVSYIKMNLLGIILIVIGGVLIIKPDWGARYLEFRMKVSLINRHNYKKIEDKEKFRKQLEIGSVIVGIFIAGMGFFVLYYV